MKARKSKGESLSARFSSAETMARRKADQIRAAMRKRYDAAFDNVDDGNDEVAEKVKKEYEDVVETADSAYHSINRRYNEAVEKVGRAIRRKTRSIRRADNAIPDYFPDE